MRRLCQWVAKHHGADGPHYIADQPGRLPLEDDQAGVNMWLKVEERFEALKKPAESSPRAQPVLISNDFSPIVSDDMPLNH